MCNHGMCSIRQIQKSAYPYIPCSGTILNPAEFNLHVLDPKKNSSMS